MIKSIQKWMDKPNLLQPIIVGLLLLGIFFRFYHLDGKVYWIDETYTSLRLSGHTEVELVRQVFNGNVIGVEELQKYQRPNPEKSFTDTIKSLAIESPQHPPLFYTMARSWVQIWGYSVATIRSLPALISLLVFPGVYWLCLELFGSSLIGWITIALIAVSPFHVLYAQEAREYSLWIVTTAVSSAAMLRAMRIKTKLSWGIYALTLATSFYTFLFSWFVAIAHGAYIIIIEKFRWSQQVTAYLLSSLAALILYTPWFVVTIANLPRIHTSSSWTTEQVRSSSLIRRWLIDASQLFFDLNLGSKTFAIPTIFVLLVLIYSIYLFCRQAPIKVRLFILALIGVPALALALPDVILGGLRSANSRYLIPCYLGLHIIVAYYLVTQLAIAKKQWQQKLWRIVAIAVVLCGIISCTGSSQSSLWWNKSPNKHKYNPEIAQMVNSSDRPLLISDDSTLISDCFACRMLSLSYILEPKVKLQLVLEPNIPKIPDGFSDVFVFSPNEALIQGIKTQQNYRASLVFKDDNFWLWKLIK